MENSVRVMTFLEIPFLVKFGPKSQNCYFKLKFGTKANLNIQSLMVVFTFAGLDQKYLLWENLVLKTQIFSLNLNFGTYTNSNIQNKMVMFTFSVFLRKYSFWANLVPKFKIVSLS